MALQAVSRALLSSNLCWPPLLESSSLSPGEPCCEEGPGGGWEERSRALAAIARLCGARTALARAVGAAVAVGSHGGSNLPGQGPFARV